MFYFVLNFLNSKPVYDILLLQSRFETKLCAFQHTKNDDVVDLFYKYNVHSEETSDLTGVCCTNVKL